MTELRGKERYEIDGQTVLYIPTERLSDEDLSAIKNKEQVTFSCFNEHSGKSHGRNMHRSIMLPTGMKIKPEGIYVYLELDINSMPVSRRELDGQRY